MRSASVRNLELGLARRMRCTETQPFPYPFCSAALVTVRTVDFVIAIRQSVAIAGSSDTSYARRAAQAQCGVSHPRTRGKTVATKNYSRAEIMQLRGDYHVNWAHSEFHSEVCPSSARAGRMDGTLYRNAIHQLLARKAHAL